jgi:hypothetical protein
MMELDRPKMDRAVLAFPKSEAASGGFHDPGGQGREAQSRVGDAGGAVGSMNL